MNKLPENIREGMAVYDRAGNNIGEVESLQFGDEAVARGDSPEGFRDDSLIDNLVEAIWPDDMPEAERAALLSEGYFVLDAEGFMARDRYVRASQIEAVTADGVRLNVERSGLAKT